MAKVAIIRHLEDLGWHILREETGQDRRRQGGAWSVTTLGVPLASAEVRTQQLGEDHELTLSMFAPQTACTD